MCLQCLYLQKFYMKGTELPTDRNYFTIYYILYVLSHMLHIDIIGTLILIFIYLFLYAGKSNNKIKIGISIKIPCLHDHNIMM